MRSSSSVRAAAWSSSLLCFVFTLSASSPSLELINNQPFGIRLPIEIRDFSVGEGDWESSRGQPVQQVGSNLMLIAEVAANGRQRLEFRPSKRQRGRELLEVNREPGGINVIFEGKNFGRLSWDIVVKDVKRIGGEDEVGGTDYLDFDREFKSLPLEFHKAVDGPVFDDWTASEAKDGLRLGVVLRCFHDGFVDINCGLTNEGSERTTNVYAAVVGRWEQAGVKGRSYCYDNQIAKVPDHFSSPFRQGAGRHLFIQRGVDWVRTSFGRRSAAWLNGFAPSFTIEAAATSRTPARFTGANLPQLGQEIQTKEAKLYSVTEIARSTIRSFRDRMKENILPPIGESVSFSSRLVFGDAKLDDRRTDELFVAWTSYDAKLQAPSQAASSPHPSPPKEERGRGSPKIEIETFSAVGHEASSAAEGNSRQFSFGTGAVRFGTSYFPYSTLGENFDFQKLPGMDRESFWPLAADTVNKWQLFADDIRRDLRIAKAMGFELIRLHHLELLAPISKETRREYLDFLFGELRHLQLKAMLDVYTSAEQITELLTRYGDVVDSVEIENETLIWGIPLDRPDEWKQLYAAIKKAAPRVQVHFTGYNNTGMFDRLTALGVPFDRVCLHSYIDTQEAIPSARGYSLALSSYATKAGKPPVITEWNWRGLTRMTEQARAEIYAQIIEGAIGTRGIPDFYQFQFNETLCPNPRVGRGNILRHYELLHLSRRPKVEAAKLMDLIRKYSTPDDPLRQFSISFPIVYCDQKQGGEAEVSIRNNTKRVQRLNVAVETSQDVEARMKSANQFSLSPGRSAKLRLSIRIPRNEPGFYYAFARISSEKGPVRYAVIEIQNPGEPKFDSTPPGIDWSRPTTVVYGEDAPVLEVETAIAIAETLESACGRQVDAVQFPDLAPYARTNHNLIAVGTSQSNKLISGIGSPASTAEGAARGAGKLVITGSDPNGVEKAGMNFILSYWKNGKDSAARRVGLVTKDLPRGGDAARLP